MKAPETIDDIRKYYKFKYDDSSTEKPSLLNRMNFALFRIHTDPYKLEEKIEKANKIIKEGKIKDSKIVEECLKQINDMKASCEIQLFRHQFDDPAALQGRYNHSVRQHCRAKPLFRRFQ